MFTQAVVSAAAQETPAPTAAAAIVTLDEARGLQLMATLDVPAVAQVPQSAARARRLQQLEGRARAK